jgi:glycosyltransferase involved in cell wall biosynthesis
VKTASCMPHPEMVVESRSSNSGPPINSPTKPQHHGAMELFVGREVSSRSSESESDRCVLVSGRNFEHRRHSRSDSQARRAGLPFYPAHPRRRRIAGRAGDELFASDSARGIQVIGTFESLTPLLETASIAVVPLRHGSGTRVKILEAFAYGLPVVSTTVGAEGLDVVDSESILIADDPGKFAHHVVRLFQDPEYATHIASAGHALFLAKYSPEVFTKTILEISRDALRT